MSDKQNISEETKVDEALEFARDYIEGGIICAAQERDFRPHIKALESLMAERHRNAEAAPPSVLEALHRIHYNVQCPQWVLDILREIPAEQWEPSAECGQCEGDPARCDPHDCGDAHKSASAAEGRAKGKWIKASAEMPPRGVVVLMRRTGSEQIPGWEWQPAVEGARLTPFRVSVQTMSESNGKVTHSVCIDRPDRPQDAQPWDEGRITPYSSEIRERVTAEAAEWQEFLMGCGMPALSATPPPSTPDREADARDAFRTFVEKYAAQDPKLLAKEAIARWGAAWDKLNEETGAELAALTSRNRQLTEALRKHGRHSKGCKHWLSDAQKDFCDCGLSAALPAQAQKEGKS